MNHFVNYNLSLQRNQATYLKRYALHTFTLYFTKSGGPESKFQQPIHSLFQIF